MENASKALIIAGAILLSILLISLGIMIFNQAQSAIDGSGMSDAELQAFNAKFLKYEGKQKGSTIKAMVQEVIAHNSSEEASDETKVSINGTHSTGKVVPIMGEFTPGLVSVGTYYDTPSYSDDFKNTKTYEVSFRYYNGRIAVIQVK